MNDFDDAITQSMQASDRHAEALRFVGDVMREYAAAVAGRTDSLVKVELASREELRFFTLPENLGKVFERHRRELGDDTEDRMMRFRALASAPGDSRILWELELDDLGFPVTLHGPEKGQTTVCYEPADLRTALVNAARSGLVGRKIAALHAKAVAAQRAAAENPEK